MTDHPYGYDVLTGIPSRYDQHTVRRLSDMKGYYADRQCHAVQVAAEDAVVYEVYELSRPQVEGELMHGTSVVHPGRVGAECFMTKGHFHALLEAGEVYYGLQGEGMIVMETLEGEWAVERLCPGRVLYVPPRWAHRSVNTSPDQDLVFLFVYPAHAGHDYRTVEQRGFRKLIVERDGKPAFVDNPRWNP